MCWTLGLRSRRIRWRKRLGVDAVGTIQGDPTFDRPFDRRAGLYPLGVGRDLGTLRVGGRSLGAQRFDPPMGNARKQVDPTYAYTDRRRVAPVARFDLFSSPGLALGKEVAQAPAFDVGRVQIREG